MGCPHYQPYPEFQSHEFNPPTYQPDYSSHYTSFPSHPYHNHPSEAGDYFPTWLNEGWKTQDTCCHQDQTCPDQHQYQPQSQQSSKPPLNENRYENSAAGEIEGLTVPQQNVQHCLEKDDELVIEMQRTCDEQQSDMGEMIRQVALLTEMIKGIQENRARSEVNESREEAEPRKRKHLVLMTSQSHRWGNKKKSKMLEWNQQKKSPKTEKESTSVLLENEMSQNIPEEPKKEPQETEGEFIKLWEGLDTALFYLQTRKMHVHGREEEKFTAAVEEKNTPAEKPPPAIDESEGCCYEEGEPERHEERWSWKAARSIYWMQLQPWPEPLEGKKPSDPGLRPKENKKIQGTYKDHKKKLGAMVI